MDAKEFAYSLRRLCKYYGSKCYDVENLGDESANCPLAKYECQDVLNMEDEVFDIVEYWAEQHPEEPKKTRQSEFLKIFPNAKMWTDDKFLKACPKDLDSTKECSSLCYDCCKKYWGEEIE